MYGATHLTESILSESKPCPHLAQRSHQLWVFMQNVFIEISAVQPLLPIKSAAVEPFPIHYNHMDAGWQNTDHSRWYVSEGSKVGGQRT